MLTEIGKKYSLDISITGKHDMLCELSQIMTKGGSGLGYIIEIVDNLEKVMSGKIEEYEFGYDATIIDFEKDIAIINYNYFEDQLEVPAKSIFNLMKDWRDFLISAGK